MVVQMLLIFLAKIHDLSKTTTQIKVQENGEYYIEVEAHHFSKKNNRNPNDLTL